MAFKKCGKATFYSRGEARHFLRKRSLQYTQKSYKCPYCHGYHNTSLDSEGRRSIKEFNNKGE